ncbi:hypothetical protein ACTMQE_13010, partial [Escherichia coli]
AGIPGWLCAPLFNHGRRKQIGVLAIIVKRFRVFRAPLSAVLRSKRASIDCSLRDINRTVFYCQSINS